LGSQPTEDDVKNAKRTSELLSGLIDMGFHVNHNVLPMPPWPAIPMMNLQKLISDSEALVMQLVTYCKQLKAHGQSKGIEAGPLVTRLAELDVGAPIGITYTK
jgi:hypothetical protein